MSRFSTSSDNLKTFSHDHQQTTQPQDSSHNTNPTRHFRVAILGTGFSGLGMAIRLKQRHYNDFVIIEQAADIGGTWRDNTYPGCACDIPSHLYSFSFALNPRWSRTYSPQGEIQAYLRHCAEQFGILPHIQWSSALQKASWQENEQRWQITTTQGQLTADIFILGQGPLSEPSLPNIPGLERFQGTLFHSAQWRHDYDLTDKRVAVIGTGASAVQFVPLIQPSVSHLSLFLRTPPWIIPRNDQAVPTWKKNLLSLFPFTQHYMRIRTYWRLETTALALVYQPARMEQGMQAARKYLEQQIPDPTLRAQLAPQYTMGCKRILLSDDFYPALTQPNVEVVTNPICEVRENSIVTEDGEERQIDTLICATGFHVTDSTLPLSIYGREGQTLADTWQDGAHAYLGTSVAGFPNLFLLLGPNTGLGHNSMVYMIESQVAYILDCLRQMKKRGWQSVEVRPESEESFNAEVQQRMQNTIWKSGCVSWYLNAGGRNTTLWPGYTFEFRRRTRHCDLQHYEALPLKAATASIEA